MELVKFKCEDSCGGFIYVNIELIETIGYAVDESKCCVTISGRSEERFIILNHSVDFVIDRIALIDALRS